MNPTRLNCNSALLTLSCFEVSVEPKSGEAHEKHIFQSRAALGTQSVLRMILDSTLDSIQVSDAELIAVPIWCLHRSYLASRLCLEFGIIDDDSEKWTIYIQSVKHMLTRLEPRCKLAGTISFLSKASVQAITDLL